MSRSDYKDQATYDAMLARRRSRRRARKLSDPKWAEGVRAAQRDYSAKSLRRQSAALGRVCGGCGRDDSARAKCGRKIFWSGATRMCSTCARRRFRNGLHECGTPRRRVVRKRGDGRRVRYYCPSCVDAPKALSSALLRLWDVAWVATESGRIVWQDVARAVGLKPDSAQRTLERMRDHALALDIGAVWDGAGKGHAPDVQSALRFDVRRLCEVVEAEEREAS